MKPNLFGKLMRPPTRFKRQIIHSERVHALKRRKTIPILAVESRVVDIGGQTKILLRVSAPPLVNAPAARQCEHEFADLSYVMFMSEYHTVKAIFFINLMTIQNDVSRCEFYILFRSRA